MKTSPVEQSKATKLGEEKSVDENECQTRRVVVMKSFNVDITQVDLNVERKEAFCMADVSSIHKMSHFHVQNRPGENQWNADGLRPLRYNRKKRCKFKL